MMEVFSYPDEGLPNLVLARCVQSRLDDKDRVVSIEVHRSVEVFRDDRSIGGFDNLLNGM